jgi:ABC-2 type transport system permease protein
MNVASNSFPEAIATVQPVAATIPWAQRFVWSVRRELWENRWLLIAPAAVAAFLLLAFTVGLAHGLSGGYMVNGQRRPIPMTVPYGVAALALMGVTFAVGIFYCADALYGERRDRSILFWKSLPVSDVTAVLAKATIPLVVLPVVAYTLSVLTQMIMMGLSFVFSRAAGVPGYSYGYTSLLQMWVVLLYNLIAVHVLWHAPIYAWLLLVSAWAKRAPLLIAVATPLVLGISEKIAFGTSYIGDMLKSRIGGGVAGGSFIHGMSDRNPFAGVDPLAFLASPGLWIGLAVAAVFIYGAIRLRRLYGPI